MHYTSSTHICLRHPPYDQYILRCLLLWLTGSARHKNHTMGKHEPSMMPIAWRRRYNVLCSKHNLKCRSSKVVYAFVRVPRLRGHIARRSRRAYLSLSLSLALSTASAHVLNPLSRSLSLSLSQPKARRKLPDSYLTHTSSYVPAKPALLRKPLKERRAATGAASTIHCAIGPATLSLTLSFSHFKCGRM